LSIRHDILGRGWEKRYRISKIENFRAAGHFGSMMSWRGNMAYWGITGGTVAFDYEGKTKRFGINLKEAEASQLVVHMKSLLSV
jgi:hypothetical protein